MSKKSNNREWEKDRRDRLNKAFTALSKLLPSYEPSRTLSKIEILSQAKSFIEELQTKVDSFVNNNQIKSTEQLEIKRLSERIKKLLARNDQLGNIIKDAGIKLPKEQVSIRWISSKYRLSNKVTTEQAKKFAKGESQENSLNEEKKAKQKKRQVNNRLSAKTQKNQKKFRRKIENKKLLKQNLAIQVPLLNYSPSRNVPLGPCYMIANTPTVNLANTSVVAKNDSIKGTSRPKTLPKSISDKVLNILGPGTLILANGTVIPIMPQSPKVVQTATILTNASPVIVKPHPVTTSSATAAIVVSTSKNNSTPACTTTVLSNLITNITIGGKVLPRIRPKRCITKTTQVNKVPIPALSSCYSSFNNIIKQEVQKKNTVSKADNRKSSKKNTTSNSLQKDKQHVKVISNELIITAKRKGDEEVPLNSKRVKTDELNNKDLSLTLVNSCEENKNSENINDKSENNAVTSNDKPQDNVKDNNDLGKENNNQQTKESDVNELVENSDSKSILTSTIEADKKTGNSIQEQLEDNNIIVGILSATAEQKIEDSGKVTTNLEGDVNDLQSCFDQNPETKPNKVTQESLTSACTLTSQLPDLKSDDCKKIQEVQPEEEEEEEKVSEDSNKNGLALASSIYHSELSNDIFSSLQVPLGSQNQESTSPTAAFLLAFPLVSTLTGVKVTEVIDEDNSDSRHGTPTLLQIGTMDSTKTSQTVPSESLTPSLLNLDNFSFFSTKDVCSGFYNSFDSLTYTTCQSTITTHSSFSTASSISSATVALSMSTSTIKNVVPEQAKNVSNDSKQVQPDTQITKDKMAPVNDYKLSQMKNRGTDKVLNNNNNQSVGTNGRGVTNVNTSYQPSAEKNLGANGSANCRTNKTNTNHNSAYNSAGNKSIDESTSMNNNNGIISNGANNSNNIPVCSVQTSHLNPSSSYSTPYDAFSYSNETKCKMKVESVMKQTPNSVLSYSQDNFSQVPYRNKDSTIPPKQHIPSVTTTVSSNINCSFSPEKKIVEQKPQITYNPNSAFLSNCNTFNPFADKLPTECNVTYTRSYNNMLYGSGSNNSNYTPSYSAEASNYVHSYPTGKVSAESYGQHKVNSEAYNQHKPNTDAYNQQKNTTDSYSQHKTNADTYSQHVYNPECKNSDGCKRDSNTHIQVANSNYFRQNGMPHKEKINVTNASNKGVKPTTQPQSQPKPPINWMTTPDLKQESSFTGTVSFGKDVDYTSNNFYSSAPFTRNSHVSCFNTNAPTYQTPEFQNTSVENKKPPENFPILPHNTVQRSEFDENQFSWSPTKLPQFFDTPHTFVSSTLPTLVGDLALGTIQPSGVQDQVKMQNEKDLNNKNKDNGRRPKQPTYDHSNSHSNFLSVSQLVEKQTDGVPARITNRRNSGSRSNKNNNISHKSARRIQKQTDTNKDCGDRVGRNYNQNKIEMPIGRRENAKMPSQRNQTSNYVPDNSTWFDYNKNQRQEPNKSSQSIYSAEALLGPQVPQNNAMFRQQHTNFPPNTKSLPIPNFLSDNIMPYFSSVDLQENNFIQQNQNFQSTALAHNFSNTVQSYTYLSNTNHITSTSNISSSYLPTTSFMSELNSQEYSASAQNNILSQSSVKLFGDKNILKQNVGVVPTINERPTIQNNDCAVGTSATYTKKSSKVKQSTENSLPGIVDFSFLSMPGTIGSPMLPDDFHVHTNLLPPPPTPGQLYPCKNPSYSKQGTEMPPSSMITLPPLPSSRNQVQNVETPPNINNISSSLTNFNLSTIFPEINKGNTFPSLTTCQRSSKSKEYSLQKNCSHRSIQVPFQNKPPNYGAPNSHTKVNN